MITFDQATQELHYNDRAIATAIATQLEAGDVDAKNIIDLYSRGIGNAERGEARDEAAAAEFLRHYEVWRIRNAAGVAPIAAQLGHPLPSTPAVAGLFAPAPPESAPAVAGVPSPAAVPAAAAVTQDTPKGATEQPAAKEPAKTKRVAWSQADVVKLSRYLLTPNPGAEDKAVLLAAFARDSEGKFDLEVVTSKAVELELIPAPTVIPPLELTDTERSDIVTAIEMIGLGDAKTRTTEELLVRYKHAAVVIRERIKDLAG